MTGADTGYTISVSENEQQATETVQAAGWVNENVTDLIASVENHGGRARFSHRANEK